MFDQLSTKLNAALGHLRAGGGAELGRDRDREVGQDAAAQACGPGVESVEPSFALYVNESVPL